MKIFSPDLSPLTRSFYSIVCSFLMIGWIFPLWLGIDFVIDYIDFFRSCSTSSTLQSFPYLYSARICFLVGTIWIFIIGVILFSQFVVPRPLKP